MDFVGLELASDFGDFGTETDTGTDMAFGLTSNPTPATHLSLPQTRPSGDIGIFRPGYPSSSIRRRPLRSQQDCGLNCAPLKEWLDQGIIIDGCRPRVVAE